MYSFAPLGTIPQEPRTVASGNRDSGSSPGRVGEARLREADQLEERLDSQPGVRRGLLTETRPTEQPQHILSPRVHVTS